MLTELLDLENNNNKDDLNKSNNIDKNKFIILFKVIF
jgi:hypothetical protein